MILPGLFPAQVRSRPTLRGTYTNNNRRASSSQISIPKADIPARPGDLVALFFYPEGSSRGPTTTNFGFIQPFSEDGDELTRSYSGYKVWDGTEPTDLVWTLSSGSLSIAPVVGYVFTGVTKLAGVAAADTSFSQALSLVTSPARLWLVSSQSTADFTGGTVPTGYTGFLQASTTAGDNGSVRSAYRIADENTQLSGNWSLSSQSYRRSMAFR